MIKSKKIEKRLSKDWSDSFGIWKVLSCVKNAGFRRLVGTGTTYSMKYCEMQLTAWESTIIDRQFSRLSFSNSSQIVYFFHSNLLICQKCRILGFFLSLFFVWILKRRAEKELKKEISVNDSRVFIIFFLFFHSSSQNPAFLTIRCFWHE